MKSQVFSKAQGKTKVSLDFLNAFKGGVTVGFKKQAPVVAAPAKVESVKANSIQKPQVPIKKKAEQVVLDTAKNVCGPIEDDGFTVYKDRAVESLKERVSKEAFRVREKKRRVIKR